MTGELEGDHCNVAVVVPVFNAGPALEELVGRLVPVLETVATSWRVVLVDDASGDGSGEVAERLAADYQSVQAVRNPRNQGQHAVILDGMRRALASVVVTMDDDLQHRPEDVSLLVALIEEGAPVATARFVAKQHPPVRRAAGRLKGFVQRKALGAPSLSLSTFTAYRGDVAAAMAARAGPRPHIPVLTLGQVTAEDIAVVDLEHRRRPYGRSNYGPVRSLRFFANAVRRSLAARTRE